MNYLVSKLKQIFGAVNRRLTAIALADVGDFDGVREILKGGTLDGKELKAK